MVAKRQQLLAPDRFLEVALLPKGQAPDTTDHLLTR